jgi:alanine racemase
MKHKSDGTQPKRIAILGATGSIGTQALEIISANRHAYDIRGLSAHSNWKKLASIANDFKPDWLILSDASNKQSFEDALNYKPILHLCNTSGIINYPEASFDMVRSGIGLYGFTNDREIDKQLKPVGTLKTIISQIHPIEKGETIGYNRAYKAAGTMKTATLPIGHADGINRQYGNERAGVFVNGQFAPIIGNVCMDMLMIDITGITCDEGDEVIIFGGPQPATKFAEKGKTISYELITGISQRVKRVIKPE